MGVHCALRGPRAMTFASAFLVSWPGSKKALPIWIVLVTLFGRTPKERTEGGHEEDGDT